MLGRTAVLRHATIALIALPAWLGLALPAIAGPKEDGRADLIERGRRLFMEETFAGNGRTCATCHPPSNNFTIDPAFIARLQPRDPLFVAELRPELRELENSDLLRRAALILVNVDGFDQPPVARAVPHLLGLSQTIAPDTGRGGGAPAVRPPFPRVHPVGWSADGAPGDGSLRQFTTGAVIQHFTRSLRREPGRDFRRPTEAELDALEAFQRSLGRQFEYIINPRDPRALVFLDDAVERGKILFEDAPARDGSLRHCSTCHAHAGANDAAGNNRSLITGAALDPKAPACLTGGAVAGDGGFGLEPVQVLDGRAICGTGPSFPLVLRGTQEINSPSVVESADTAPLFHNHIAATIEDSVAFYAGETFNRSAQGGGRAFVLDTAAVNDLGAFLRALNAVDNIRQVEVYLDQALGADDQDEAEEAVRLAIADTNDAIEVLTRGPIRLFAATRPDVRLRRARDRLFAFLDEEELSQLGRARVELRAARSLMVR
jgi:cytochrome c peroxidase